MPGATTRESRLGNRIADIIFLFLAFGLLAPALRAQSRDKITLAERVMTASTIYHQVSTFFPDLAQKSFDQQYREYLKAILNATDDRLETQPQDLKAGRNAVLDQALRIAQPN
jgi:hypothetical protein